MSQVVTQHDALDIVKSTIEVIHKNATKREIRKNSQKVLKDLRDHTVIYDEVWAHIEIQVEASTANELGLKVTINRNGTLAASTQFIDLDPVKAQGMSLMVLFAEILQGAPSHVEAVHLAAICRTFLMAADYIHRFPEHALPHTDAPFKYAEAA